MYDTSHPCEYDDKVPLQLNDSNAQLIANYYRIPFPASDELGHLSATNSESTDDDESSLK